MSNAINRRLRILQLLPHKKDGMITVPRIMKLLREDGIDAETRAVQRDMDELSCDFPINCNDTEKPFRWYWDANEVLAIPAMGQFTALTFQLAEEMLKPLLPKQSFEYLKPNFSTARQVLHDVDKRKAHNWLKKIRVVPRSLRQISAPIKDGIYDTVTQALYDDVQLEVTYMAASNKTSNPKIHRINPYALLHRNSTTELICNLDDTDKIVRLLLHRIQAANSLNSKSKKSLSFDLDTFIDKDLAQPFSGKEIKFKAWIHKYGKAHVIETPLCKDQKIEDANDDGIIVTATIRETIELKWWILGLGERIKVLGPTSLRDDIARTVKETAKLYK